MGTVRQLLFPRYCVGCDADASWWCSQCEEQTCSALQQAAEESRSAVFTGELAKLLVSYKDGKHWGLVPAVGGLIALRLRLAGLVDSAVTLVPAPQSGLGHFRRGGWPFLAACRAAAAQLPGTTVWTPLRRHWSSQPQRFGSIQQRRQLHVEFRARGQQPNLAETGPVVLIDDVRTTGSTLASCTEVLAREGTSPSAVCWLAQVE